MNIENIKEIVNSKNISDELIVKKLLFELAKDEKAIPMILEIMESERKIKKSISQDMNVLLGKSAVGLDNPKFNKDNFIFNEIKEFYIKYKDYIGNPFINYFNGK